MRKIIFLMVSACLSGLSGSSQIDAGLFAFPDVSQTQIVFSYANDLWIVSRSGGAAEKLSSPPGVETFPRFSPDGKSIAFTGNYDGNKDVYVIPVTGGIPVRVTEHGFADRVVDWTPDGRRVLFASGRESGRDRFNQFYTVSYTGGPAEKLPFPYAEFGSYSADGKSMALVFESQAFRNWKRYRGGWKANIHIFHFADNTSEDISNNEVAGDEFPMWSGNFIYFLSDRGPEVRLNLWRYDLASKKMEQLTHYSDYDIHFPSLGPQDIVFEQGGKLCLYSLTSGQVTEVKVTVITDRSTLKPRMVAADKFIQHGEISPDGNRALLEARGDIFSLPAKDGVVKDLTQTSGVGERYPAWSPDGKTIAYWSDASGEYELYVLAADGRSTPRKVTSYGPGFRYSLSWSPDSKKLAFIDKAMSIQIVDVATGNTTKVDKALRFTHGSLERFAANWSPDSRWLTYSRDLDNYHNAIFIFDDQEKKLHQVTDGYYSCDNPVFDAEGKYLFLTTSQTFTPYYSDLDNTFIYSNATKLAAISLKKSTPELLFPKNDTVAVKTDEPKPEDKKPDDKKKGDDKDKKPEPKKPDVAPVEIDFDRFEARLVQLPPDAGNYGRVAAAKGKIIYLKLPATGVSGGHPSLQVFNIEKREEKTILENVNDFALSANREKILVIRGDVYAIIGADEGQKFDKPLRTGDMLMTVDPEAEWKQIFNDAWRLERDYFYDPNMHGVDWNAMRVRYGKMLEGAMTREEVNFVIGEMLGELNSSHTYHGGGDLETEARSNVGYLGVNWQADGDYYKIKTILHGADWDSEDRSPLDASGVDIHEGDYILAVDGVPVNTKEEPFAFFQGLAKKTVELTYNSKPTFTGAKTAIVQTIANEYPLRYLNWVEANRKRVDEATGGQVGYIYVPSTGLDGQDELARQFNAQWTKKALIIDERFNSGGQIPDRFIEMLNRTPLAFWATRDGSVWPWPYAAHFGPKVMLINGWSGSGGDAFPDFFRKKGLGPLIGARTWGGLIGISGVPDLIDGGIITAPSFRMFNVDGTWFKEGHGVDPDIAVDEDLGSMARGVDPQLERAIQEIQTELKQKAFNPPAQPPYEKRN